MSEPAERLFHRRREQPGSALRPIVSHSRRPSRRPSLRRGAMLVVAAGLALVQVGASPAGAAPSSIDVAGLTSDTTLSPDQKQALAQQLEQQPNGPAGVTTPSPAGAPSSGPAAFLLELDTPSTSAAYSDAVTTKGADAAATDATTTAATIETKQAQVTEALPQTVPDAKVLYTTKAVTASVAVVADAADQKALYGLPNVADVRPITPKIADNAGTAQTIGTPAAWQALGQQGQGVSVGVIDTGIDYTHSDFGGPGDPAVFDSIPDAGPVPAGLFPSAKVLGGYDFTGDAYNADPASPDFQPVPTPDANPLDCEGHGSHVAGTVAGYGVNADGSTYAGPYDETTPLDTLSIGPGMAPGADLYALRVFGCTGSTNVVGQAIEWALDPNGDGNPADHLDVLNLSLGSAFGVPDDGDAAMVTKAVDAGVMVVASAGNEGDVTDVSGTPGAAPKALSVAASVDANDVLDGYTLSPEVSGVPTPAAASYSVNFDFGATGGADVTAPLALPQGADDPTACAPLTGDYTGQILVIEAAGFACGSAAKGATAKAAHAAGFAIISDDDSLAVGISGDAEIPGLQVTHTDGTAITQALAAGQAISITFGPSLHNGTTRVDPAQVDQIAEFTSRGKHAAGGGKPDLAAPGQTLFSVGVGTGTGGATNSGTSMAAPVTTGVAALVLGLHPDWTPAEVKADLMNTATHDLFTDPGQTGQIYGPARVGAGRIDAAQAVANDVLAYVQEDPGVVSASFGPVEVTEPVSLNKTIRVVNKGSTTTTYDVSYAPATELPGVTYTLDRETVTVAAGETANVVLTLKIDQPTELRKVIDPTMDPQDGQRQFLADASGRVVLTPDADAVAAGAPPLWVPVYSAPRPASTFSAEVLGPDPATAASLTLSGTGVANGAPGAPDSYASLVSVFEQLGASPELPDCTPDVTTGCVSFPGERAADLSVVGATTTVPTVDDPLNATMYVAIGTHGTAAAPSAVADYGIVIDADGDPSTIEGVVWTARLPDSGDLAAGGAATDVLISYVTDAAGNLLPSADDPAVSFLNDLPGDVDSQVFDTDARVVPVPLGLFPGISEGNPRLHFGVFAVSAYGATDGIGAQVVDGVVTMADPMTYNAYSPGLFTTSGLGNPAVNLPVAGPGVLPVAVNPAEYAANGGGGLLAVFNQNTADAGHLQSLPVPVPAPIPVGG